ncbi:DinB family protein [Gracilimonas sp.]|uniref:DinB family protein n=1 Tax=Gracilimonas sp. TaxID=1974203 RepID=UPI002870EAD8|nr:DinB family protein [Gracilimonas sp.]
MKNSEYTYDYFLKAFEQAKQTATDLSESVNEEVFLRKPHEDKWCMGEILSHLVEAGNEYLPQIKKALDKPDNKLSKGKPPFTPNFVFRWFIGQVSPENRRKLPTVSAFEPVQGTKMNSLEVLSDFLKLQDQFIHILKKAKLEGLDLDRIKARNPIIKIVPMSLSACFRVQEAHQRRHFEKMRELKERFS